MYPRIVDFTATLLGIVSGLRHDDLPARDEHVMHHLKEAGITVSTGMLSRGLRLLLTQGYLEKLDTGSNFTYVPTAKVVPGIRWYLTRKDQRRPLAA